MQVQFILSAASPDQFLHTGVPEVAMVGRSNVGKSSLINALVKQKVARTSAAPGKTRLANIFRVTVEGGPGGPGRWALYLVDLPGYGYARGGADSAHELAAVASAYFEAGLKAGAPPQGTAMPEDARRAGPQAGGSRATLLLVDSRHPGLDSDIQAHRWLSRVGATPWIVATKVDKLSRADRVRNLKDLERVFGSAPLPVSATGGEGLDELWRLIAKAARENR